MMEILAPTICPFRLEKQKYFLKLLIDLNVVAFAGSFTNPSATAEHDLQTMKEEILSETLSYTPGHPSFHTKTSGGEVRDAAVSVVPDKPDAPQAPGAHQTSNGSVGGTPATTGNWMRLDESRAGKELAKVCWEAPFSLLPRGRYKG